MKCFLTREECTAMKGIAILGIMLHNYSHWLKGIIRENEYTWLQWKCDKLWELWRARVPLPQRLRTGEEV